MTDDTHTIRSGSLTATIKAHRAELCSLKDGSGTEFVWQAGPAWQRYAPLLFPIVGRLANDEMRHRGRTYQMTRLLATYAIDDRGLDLSLTVINTGGETLPVSLGGHPAFKWPKLYRKPARH